MNLFDPILHSRAFWVGFVQGCVHTASCPSLNEPPAYALRRRYEQFTLSFAFPDEFHLLWTFDGCENPLELRHLVEDPQFIVQEMRLAWLDCHQMSDLLRWEEFQALVSYLGEHDSDRPSWMIGLLLSPYVVVTPNCADAFFALLYQNLQACSVFSAEETHYIHEYARNTWVRPELYWVEDETLGWVLEGAEYSAFSMRTRRIAKEFDASTFDFNLVTEFFQTWMPALQNQPSGDK